MSSATAARWPFAVILFLHLAAILLFTRGFLLTRTELPFYSACSDVVHSPCYSAKSLATSATSGGSGKCWTRPAVGRLVLIVLDALRFDFVAPSIFFDEVKPWMDKLEVLQKLASDEKTSAKIFKAIADPPTTSLQRLKGLTTGGLPTFIDVGNSFGAPAIVEDNLLYQLAKNGKRVLMVGDDTWLQLFPDHFAEAHPYPSFNVRDLHTVDNGCVEHLFPSLLRDDWDVLVAHFLGVDHAGHIFGVDSSPMIEKLEQYNSVLEAIVEILKNHSGPGDLHENTFLIVMGDHGQTLNGDHGGGTAEEVETSLFAMSLKSTPLFPMNSDAITCKEDLDAKKMCVSSIQQLDFAVTIAALLGIPFPFGSIGRVNDELYALSAGTWNREDQDSKTFSDSETWMRNFVDTLCVNSWQVKRYIDLYSSTSVIGFSSEDLQQITERYVQAQSNWISYMETLFYNSTMGPSIFHEQIRAYSVFLEKVAELARSKWTEFDLKQMGAGFFVLFFSLLFQVFAIWRIDRFMFTGLSFRFMFSITLVMIRAASFLSNSYILAEGKVANFLLATASVFDFHHSVVSSGQIKIEEAAFLLLAVTLRLKFDIGSAKAVSPTLSSSLRIVKDSLPFASMALLTFLVYFMKTTVTSSRKKANPFLITTFFNYLLISIHWLSASDVSKYLIPQMVYIINFAIILLLILLRIFKWKSLDEDWGIASVDMLCGLSSSILLLSGTQGPVAALIFVTGVSCIIQSQMISERFLENPIPVVKWWLLALCLFFYTGHWCAFDGLRYGAAFTGFENFNLIRQGVLLSIETFGFSHLLPIFGLPLLVFFSKNTKSFKEKRASVPNLILVFLLYGLMNATTTTLTVICVAIQRRHLMVWGLFAPKYVFDVVGLMLTDVLILAAALYYT